MNGGLNGRKIGRVLQGMTYMEIPEGDPDERRRYHRQLALIGVKLRRPGETWFTSRIADLTATGFRLHSFVTLTPGDIIWVMFSGFEGRRATVIWNKDYESGCIFERPLHSAVLDHIVRMS